MASIKKEGTSWYFVVSNGVDPVTFKPRQIKKRGFNTKEEAELAAMEVELQIKKGLFFKGENMKFQLLYDNWIEEYSYTRKKSSIRNRKKSAKHLLNVWQNVPINKISKQGYRKHMNSLISNYKYNTREGIHIVAKMIFDYAVDMEYLNVNPTDNYDIPKDKVDLNKKKGGVFLEKSELYEFLDIAKKEGLENDFEFFSFLAFTGTRIGELMGLMWKDIDYKHNSISINKTIYNPNNNKQKAELNTTKNTQSTREINISPYLINLLATIKDRQENTKHKNKDAYRDQGFVFTCNQGYPRSYRLYANRLARLIKKMEGLNKHITSHSFRHTHASLLIEANAPVIFIADRLGHSSMETTDKIYSHLTEGVKEIVLPQVNELTEGYFKQQNSNDHLSHDGNHDQKNDH